MMGLIGWGVCGGGGDGVYWDMDRDRAPVCSSWMVEIWSIDGDGYAMNGLHESVENRCMVIQMVARLNASGMMMLAVLHMYLIHLLKRSLWDIDNRCYQKSD